jgi:phosphonate transport system substrate-binding protein
MTIMQTPMNRRAATLSLLAAALPARMARAQSMAPLEIGVLPNISARALLAQYQPMREYLGRELKRAVQVSTAPHWASFQQRTLAYEYDVVVTASHVARLAQLDGGWQPLLIYAPGIKGMIAFAQQRPIKAIADLRGQTLVLSNPQSLVALRGLQWLSENGLQRDRDFKAINTPTDDSVGNVVVRGDAVAAMLSGGEYRAIPEATRAQVSVLATFAEVPGFVVMASPRLAAADARAVKELLSQFIPRSDEGKAFAAATGFTGIGELPTGLMESMDAYAGATRKLLVPAG